MTTSNAVFSAYLKPLLKKHAVGQYLTYDDLMEAWDIAVRCAGSDATIQVSAFNLVVHPAFVYPSIHSLLTNLAIPISQKQLQTLHDSQLQEYTQVAEKALMEYAQTVELAPDMEDTGTEQLYIDKCLAVLQIPEWKVPDAQQRVTSVVQQRASAAWQNRQNSSENSSNNVKNDNPIEEDENDDEDEEDDVEEKQSAGPTTTAKKRKRRKIAAPGSKPPAPATKVAAARGGRKTVGARGRRGGRGGVAGKA